MPAALPTDKSARRGSADPIARGGADPIARGGAGRIARGSGDRETARGVDANDSVRRNRAGRPARAGARRPYRQGKRPGPGRERGQVDPARRAAIAAFDPAASGFSPLGVPAAVVRILGVDGITEPTAVQSAVIPDAMAGRDVLGRARTGSGKTLAFGLPILTRLAGRRSGRNQPRALIIVPTRELAGQVAAGLEPLAEAVGLSLVTVYGGAPYERQLRRLSRGVDIVVATPGRLEDLVARGACRLDAVEVVVLDEADHLCDLGFYPVVSALVAGTPQAGQRLLLSATLDGDVDRLVRQHLVNPARHHVDPDAGAVETMDHHVLLVGAHSKLDVTIELARANPRSIVFTRTKQGASRLASDLVGAGVPAIDLHGDLSQRARERNLDRFRTGRAQVVVATDVAARGLHVTGVGMVVHYDPASEPKAYLHRSGRTARAGASGAVVSVATPAQARQLTQLHQRAGVAAKHTDVRRVTGPLTAEGIAAAPAAEHRTAPVGAERGRATDRGRAGGRGRINGRRRSNPVRRRGEPRGWTGQGAARTSR
jgi:superfamily II DNA/RNA helicase